MPTIKMKRCKDIFSDAWRSLTDLFRKASLLTHLPSHVNSVWTFSLLVLSLVGLQFWRGNWVRKFNYFLFQ